MSKLVVILVSPHFQKTKSLNSQVMMKWTWKWWVNVFLYQSHVFYFSLFFFVFCILRYFILLSQLRRLVIPRLWTTCRRGNKHFDVHLRRIKTVHFLSKDGKGASYDGRRGWKACLFPARVGISDFNVIMYEVLFPICALTWRVNTFFPPGKGINRRNESTGDKFFIFVKYWW